VVSLFKFIRSSQEKHAQKLFEVARNSLSDMVKDHPSAYEEFEMALFFGDPEEFYEFQEQRSKKKNPNKKLLVQFLGFLVILFLFSKKFLLGKSYNIICMING
jgi:hypothetical protein